MLPTLIFRNRKVALFWAVLICWVAVEFASSFNGVDTPPPADTLVTAKPGIPGAGNALPPAAAAPDAGGWSAASPPQSPMIHYDSDGDGKHDSVTREVQ